MYMMLDALADGGVYAGIPKDLGLKLIAHTMMVSLYDYKNSTSFNLHRLETYSIYSFRKLFCRFLVKHLPDTIICACLI